MLGILFHGYCKRRAHAGGIVDVDQAFRFHLLQDVQYGLGQPALTVFERGPETTVQIPLPGQMAVKEGWLGEGSKPLPINKRNADRLSTGLQSTQSFLERAPAGTVRQSTFRRSENLEGTTANW